MSRIGDLVRRNALVITTVLAVVVVGGGIASVTRLYPGGSHRLSSVDSSWRTQWAQSLGFAGELPGSRLSCRLVAHVSLSGTQVRFRLVNHPSTGAVTFTHLVAALRTANLSVDGSTQREVTVGGQPSVTLPANGQVLTDPVNLAVQRGQDLTLSLAVGSGISAPWHYWSSQPGGCTAPDAGDLTTALNGERYDRPSQDRWLSEVQVMPTASVPTIAVYGDSLSDGLFLAPDSGARWTDRLEDETGGRLVALNFGVSGDRITGQAPPGQPPTRLLSDVLAAKGVSAVLVQMGSNDIKAGVSAQDILAEYEVAAAAIAKTHATLIVATVPGRADHLPRAAEHQRQLLNAGLRRYPIVADMDEALTDPHAGRLLASYDVGDHVHPNDTGVVVITRVMRSAISRVPGPLGAAAR